MEKIHTIIIKVAEALGPSFDAYFEVEATNDFVSHERFKYPNRKTAIEVARALSLNYSNVAVHAVFEYGGGAQTIKRTIYLEECEDEDIVITADGILKEEE